MCWHITSQSSLLQLLATLTLQVQAQCAKSKELLADLVNSNVIWINADYHHPLKQS